MLHSPLIKKIPTRHPTGYLIETLFQTRYHSTSRFSPCPHRHIHACPLCTADVPSEPTYRFRTCPRIFLKNACAPFSVGCSEASSPLVSDCLAPSGSSLLSHIRLLLLVIAFALFNCCYLNTNFCAVQGVNLINFIDLFCCLQLNRYRPDTGDRKGVRCHGSIIGFYNLHVGQCSCKLPVQVA